MVIGGLRACVTKVGLGREAHEKPNKSGSSAVEKRGLAEKNYVEFRAKRTFVDVHIQSVAEIPNEFGKSHIHDAGPLPARLLPPPAFLC